MEFRRTEKISRPIPSTKVVIVLTAKEPSSRSPVISGIAVKGNGRSKRNGNLTTIVRLCKETISGSQRIHRASPLLDKPLGKFRNMLFDLIVFRNKMSWSIVNISTMKAKTWAEKFNFRALLPAAAQRSKLNQVTMSGKRKLWVRSRKYHYQL